MRVLSASVLLALLVLQGGKAVAVQTGACSQTYDAVSQDDSAYPSTLSAADLTACKAMAGYSRTLTGSATCDTACTECHMKQPPSASSSADSWNTAGCINAANYELFRAAGCLPTVTLADNAGTFTPYVFDCPDPSASVGAGNCAVAAAGAASTCGAACAFTTPLNGEDGTCTASLASGATCQPVCDAATDSTPAYTASGMTSCSHGILTAATCELAPDPVELQQQGEEAGTVALELVQTEAGSIGVPTLVDEAGEASRRAEQQLQIVTQRAEEAERAKSKVEVAATDAASHNKAAKEEAKTGEDLVSSIEAIGKQINDINNEPSLSAEDMQVSLDAAGSPGVNM